MNKKAGILLIAIGMLLIFGGLVTVAVCPSSPACYLTGFENAGFLISIAGGVMVIVGMLFYAMGSRRT